MAAKEPMNKEQLESLIRDGKIEQACVVFADYFKIPASDVAGFVAMMLEPHNEKS